MKAQGSLEYLLILAAILTIAVVVVVVAGMMTSAPEEMISVNEEKYVFSVQGVELYGYDRPYNPRDITTAPARIVTMEGEWTEAKATAIAPPETKYLGQITDTSNKKRHIYVNTTGPNYYITGSQLDFGNSLVAYWPMEGDSMDLSGNNLHLTQYNSPGWDEGVHGQAAVFGINPDASTRRMYRSNTAKLNMGEGSMTVAMWVNAQSANEYITLYMASAGGGASGYGAGFAASRQYRTEVKGSTAVRYAHNSVVNGVPLNTWFHLAVVFDADENFKEVYRNGNSLIKINLAADPGTVSMSGGVMVGAYSSGSWSLNGKIDELMVFNRTLTVEEIQSLASA